MNPIRSTTLILGWLVAAISLGGAFVGGYVGAGVTNQSQWAVALPSNTTSIEIVVEAADRIDSISVDAGGTPSATLSGWVSLALGAAPTATVQMRGDTAVITVDGGARWPEWTRSRSLHVATGRLQLESLTVHSDGPDISIYEVPADRIEINTGPMDAPVSYVGITVSPSSLPSRIEVASDHMVDIRVPEAGLGQWQVLTSPDTDAMIEDYAQSLLESYQYEQYLAEETGMYEWEGGWSAGPTPSPMAIDETAVREESPGIHIESHEDAAHVIDLSRTTGLVDLRLRD